MDNKTRIRSAASIAAVLAVVLANSRTAIAEHPSLLVERDVGAVITSILDAWTHADAHAIAALYEPDGDFVSPNGLHAAGRQAIEAFYSAAFNAGYAGSSASATVLKVRNPAAAFALIDGSWRIEPTPKSKITASEAGLFVALLHYDAGHWRIVALREQTSAQALQELTAAPLGSSR